MVELQYRARINLLQRLWLIQFLLTAEDCVELDQLIRALVPWVRNRENALNAFRQQISVELTELQEFLKRLFCVRKLLKTRNAQLYDFHSLVANVWLFDQLQKFLHHFARSVALYEISGIYWTAFKKVSYREKTVVFITHKFGARVSSFISTSTSQHVLFVFELVHQGCECFQNLKTERWIDEVVTERDIGATPKSVCYYACLACVLLQ
jgi:hypothetical protein